MPKRIISFNLDIAKKDNFPKFEIKQFDNATLNVNLLENGLSYNANGSTAKLFVGANEEMYLQDKNITVNGNSIVINLDKNILSEKCTAYGEIELTDSNGVATTTTFIFKIVKKIGEGANIPDGIDGFVARYEKLANEFKATINNEISSIEARFNELTASKQGDSEVIDARKGEVSLKAKIDKIDSQMETIGNLSVNVDMFRNLFNNDDDAISKAIEKVGINGTLEFSNRVYEITKPIEIQGKAISLKGKGGNSTEIKAMAEMESMVITSNSSGFHGHNFIEGLVFNTNNLAKSCIDAAYSRYMTIKDNRFLASNSIYILKIGSWVNRIINNKFTSNESAYGVVLVSDTNNNTLIKNNAFSSLKVGVKFEQGGNDVIIDGNSFDMCINTGILMQLGNRHVVIKDNYFEGCGLNSTTTVQVGVSTYENWEGAIICHTSYDVLTYTFNSLTIENNMFANCNSNSLITLSNMKNVVIDRNTIHDLYTCKNFITLKKNALPENKNSRFYYNHINTNNKIDRILNLETSRNRDFTNNITTNLEALNLDTNIENYTQVTPSTPLIISKKTDFGEYFELSSSTASRVIEKEFTVNGVLEGKNIQIEYETKGKDASTAVWFTLYLDGVEIENIQKSSTEWNKVSSMFVLPNSTQKIKLRIRPLASDVAVLFRNFNVKIF